ncbi:isochorismatase domain-containing protein 2 isoform X2 [Phaenicophaeus curvirostris]|uniref:isochorismatase domain-containing protein 2 isoform X2 n=1 Tax=Phaenicophaeus curvirostris TaxID=33595 RepID=UPI0037F0FD54
MAASRLGLLAPSRSVLLLCDLQERFRHSVAFFPEVVAVASRVLQGCRVLGVPVVVTEQRPDILGPTVPELGVQDLPKHPKTCFSMLVPAVEAELRANPKIEAAILCGIETQACIMPAGSRGGSGETEAERSLPEHQREPPPPAAARRPAPPLQAHPAADQGAGAGLGALAPFGGAGGALTPPPQKKHPPGGQ